jgi:hypothetical protein
MPGFLTTIGETPTGDALERFGDSITKVVRWVDVYEADGVTPWNLRIPVVSGQVSVDMGRLDRRNIDAEMYCFGFGPGRFWYDKIVRPYHGVRLANGDEWVTPLGTFFIDTIERPHFPRVVRFTGRDYAKRLMLDRFNETTTFTAGLNVGAVIQAIATNAGITKFKFEETTSTLIEDVTFEKASDRAAACEELAKSIGYEVFFDRFEFFVFRPWVDPATAPIRHTFRADGSSNMASFTRSTDDSQLFNVVLVHGSGTDNGLVWGAAENTNPASPTNIATLGRRVMEVPSQFVASNAAANQMAANLLAVAGLEQYNIQVDALVAPWLEVGEAVEFLDPNPNNEGDPTRYLLTELVVPLELGTMSGSMKRVTIVG